MKYKELNLHIEPYNEAAADVLAALLADAGCESFVPETTGLKAYVQTKLFNAEAINEAIAAFDIPGIQIHWEAADAPDENWNATWEESREEHPVDIGDGMTLTIRPRQAFGSGDHETTRMMLRQIAAINVQGLTVVDAGCGTGILGLAALRRGAADVYAYDIDEWSVRNTDFNWQLNFEPGSNFHVAEGDASQLANMPKADLLLANINRNILLTDIPAFAAQLNKGGRLVISGFLEADIKPLTTSALTHGLQQTGSDSEGEWRALIFKKV